MKAKIFLCLISLFSLISTGLVRADAQSIRVFEDALRLFEAGDFNAALVEVRDSLEHDPGNLPAKVLMGRIRLKLGHPKAAEEAFEEARRLGASSSLMAVPLAQARNQLGKFKLNIESIGEADLNTDAAADLWVELGNAWLALGKFLDAEIAFEKSLTLESDKVGGLLGLASVHLEEGHPEKAEELARRALEVAPDSADAWFIMGSLLESKSELAQAEAHFVKALEFDANHQKAQLALAVVVLSRNRPTEAVPMFRAILEKTPWSLEAAYLLSQALGGAGQPEAAEEALRNAAKMVAKVKPKDLLDHPRLLLISSLVLYDANQLENASLFLQKYLANRPRDVQARKQSAKLASLTGKPLDAIRELRSLAVERPKDAQIQVMLGDIYADIKDYILAEQHYRNAIGLSVPDLKLISRLGFAQYGQGRADLAVDTMRRLVDLAPGRSAGASIFLGILYLHLGELESAKHVAEDIATRMPENLLAINLQAVVAVAQKEYERGRVLFESVLAREPGFDPARINLIKLDIVEEKYARAKKTLDDLLFLEPDNLAILRTYAEYFLAQKDYRKAARYLDKILTFKPDAISDALLLSRVYEVMGEPDDALKMLHAMENEVPDSVFLKQRLAELYLARDDIDSARATLVDAAKLAGSHVTQRVAVAELQIRAGAYDDAIQGMQRSLSEYPDAAEPQLVLAKIHALQGRFLQADDTVTRLLEMYPSNAEAMSLLGDIRLSRGQVVSAIAIYRRAANIDDSPALAVSLHKAMLAAGQDGVALKELADWHQRHPDNEIVMRVLADHYVRAGQREKAVSLYRKVIEINPGDVTAHNNLAVALLPLDSEEALKAAARAYELAPENTAVLDTYGWIQVQLGNLESGLSVLREALIRDESVPEIRYHLAVALEEFGNRDAARRELRRALVNAGDFAGRADAEERLARLERRE